MIILALMAPVLVIATVRPHWLLTVLLVSSGTAMGTTFFGDSILLELLGGLNAASLSLLWMVLTMSVILLTQLAYLRIILRRIAWHILFLGFAALSLFWSSDVLLGAREYLKLLFPLLTLLTAFFVWRRRPRPTMLRLMYSAGMIIAVTGPFVYLFFDHPGIVVWASLRLYSGSWAVPPWTFGSYAALLTIYALVEHHYNRKSSNLIWAGVFAAGALGALIRATIFPLFIVVGVYFLLTSKSPMRLMYLPASAVILFAALITVAPLRERTFNLEVEPVTIITLFTDPGRLLSTETIRFSRARVWTDVYEELYRKRPLEGSGLGSFEAPFVYNPEDRVRPAGNAVGGTYIGFLGELGLLGLSLYLVAMMAYLVRLWRIYRKSTSRLTRKYALIGLLWLLYYLGFSFAYNPVDYWTIPLLVFSMIGITFAVETRRKAPGLRAVRANTGVKPLWPCGRWRFGLRAHFPTQIFGRHRVRRGTER